MTVECPACGHATTERTIDGTSFDVCAGGCGGIWFDWHELERVDEPGEAHGELLLDVPVDPGTVVDHDARRACPRCPGITMMRHYRSVKRRVEVDECASCGGYWLDAGELRQVREQFRSDDERRQVARAYFEDVFGRDLAKMRDESAEQAEQAHRIAHALRFLCPSYYLPGDQEWGAF
ncbi:MAG: zf-TFIIB domain-containing protein [Acidimicrobiia bacterium]|nr:zf-TFIIB domain-containing protein [Acidimicrobiia bacterium]